MQNLLLDRKKIFVTFKISLLTLIMLVGAESIGIVELGFTAFQHILLICSAVSSPNHTVSSFVNVYHTIEKKHLFFKCHFLMIHNSSNSPVELLEAASSCFADAKNYNSTGIYPEMINFIRKIPLLIKSMRTQFKFTQGLI